MTSKNQSAPVPTLTEESLRQQIEARAYEIYLERGRIEGFQDQDWSQAEDEIIGALAQAASETKIKPAPTKKMAARV